MNETHVEQPSGAERVAAAVALMALGAAVIVALIGAVTNWRALLITLCGLLVMTIGGWYAVSRRGFVRLIALLVMVAGVALLVVAGFALEEVSLLRVVLLVVLAGVSIAAASLALRRDPRATRRAVRERTPAPPAQRPVLIMNPKSGGGKVERFHLVDECHKRGIEPIVLERGDDLLQLAEEAIACGADVIGMAGGDGSQALIAECASRHGIPQVVVPAGTRNHFALDLGLDRDDVVGALDAFHDGVERRIDLAAVNGRVFVNNASLGLYAKIVESPEYRDAKGKTAAAMLPQLLGPDATPLDLRFTGPDGAVRPTADIILVSNDPYELHSLRGRGTRERLDMGALGVVAARIDGAGEAALFVALEGSGHVNRFPGWTEWTAPGFRIDSQGPVDIGVDGEALRMDPPLIFETRPGALRVRIPRKASGLSPAARAVHVLRRSTITELSGVIAGRRAA